MALWKQLLVLVAMAGLAIGGWEGYRRHLAPPPSAEAKGGGGGREIAVETAVAVHETLPLVVEAVGTTRARQSIEVVPLVSGRVVEMLFAPGQRIEAGDVLVRLDDDIERANLTEAEALLAEQTQAIERARRLQQTNAIAMASLEQVISARAAAEAAVDRARRRLADREIRAPFAGVAGFTDTDIGARVDDETVITTLDDLSEVEVEFSLPETLFAQIAAGQPVDARAAAFPDRQFAGQVASVDSRIDPVGRSFRVRAVIPNREGVLPSGMFMFLALTLSETTEVVVPEEAIIVQAAQTYVYAVEGDRAVRRPVVTGLRRDGKVAVTSGIEPGETVVVRGTQRLRDGAKVRVLGGAETAAARVGGGT